MRRIDRLTANCSEVQHLKHDHNEGEKRCESDNVLVESNGATSCIRDDSVVEQRDICSDCGVQAVQVCSRQSAA